MRRLSALPAKAFIYLMFMSCVLFSSESFSQHKRYMGEAMFESTMDEYQMGNYKKAAEGFRRFIAFAPNDFNGHYLLAHCYRFLGKKEDALDYYKKAISIKPADYDAYLYAGQMLRELNRPETAESYFLKAHDILPNDPDALVALGYISIDKGDHNEASSYFTKALVLSNRSFDAIKGLGILAMVSKDYFLALTHFQAADSLKANDYGLLTLLAEANEKLENTCVADSLREKLNNIKNERK